MGNEIISIGSPVKDFVSSFLEQVNKGIQEQGFVFCKKDESHAEMELNAVETTEKGGGIKIHIFTASGKIEDMNSQKMRVYVKKPSDLDKEKEKFDIEIIKEQGKNVNSFAYKDFK